MVRRWMALAGLLAASACARLGGAPLPPVDLTLDPGTLEFGSVSAGYQRTFERSFTEAPFAYGPLAVVAPDASGDLGTYRLVPCGAGAVCAGSAHGPMGQLLRTPDWVVVRGLYGRTFWLSWGGDGYVERGGHYTPLAWDARANGTGDGDDPALETPFRH